MTSLVLTILMVALFAVQPALAKDTLLVNRIGPSASELFVANGDGSGERKLFAETGFDYDASFSTDGKWIVFTSERKGAADIYRVRPDGTGLERLTSNAGFNDAAAFSPDGTQLVFISTRNSGSANIWILDLKTRNALQLTDTTGPNANFRPSWSPDGKWIAFSSDRNTEADRHVKIDHAKGRWEHLLAASLYVIKIDGTGLRRLTPAGKFAGSPKWSPDGKRIVFYELPVEDTFAARGFGAPASQIVSVDVATGTRRDYTSGPGLKVSPQFLSANRIGYVMKAGSRTGLAFTTGDQGANGQMRNATWSPDGKRVVYQKWSSESWHQNQQLFSIDPKFDLA